MPSSPEKLALLDSVPDWGDWTRLTDWINQRQELESSWQAALTGGRNDSNWISLEWNEIATPTLPPFGYYSSPLWRKFVTAAYFADLCSYPAPDDQVSFERLLFVMHAFPQGFKVWFFAKTEILKY